MRIPLLRRAAVAAIAAALSLSCSGAQVRVCEVIEVTLSTPPAAPNETRVTIRCDGEEVLSVQGPEVQR